MIVEPPETSKDKRPNMAKEFTKCRFTGRPILKSLIKMIGGKSKSRDLIYQYMPREESYQYFIEPFMGSCTVSMGMSPSPVEIVGDLNPYGINFYRFVRNDPWSLFEGVNRALKGLDKEKWLGIRDTLNDPYLKPLDKAVAYYIVNKASMNAVVRFNLKGECNSSYCGQTSARGWMTWEWLWKVHKRVQDVSFLNSDWMTSMEVANDEDTFAYLDPPYYEVFTLYDKIRFSKEDHWDMANYLTNFKGKFLLSLNDVPEVRDLYKDFYLYPIQIHYSVSQTASGRGFKSELLISNYSCDYKVRAIQSRLEEQLVTKSKKPIEVLEPSISGGEEA